VEAAACRCPRLDSLLAEADIVSVHAPLTAATRNLLNGERLRLMKASAVLIVTSRGGIVDEEALADMLERRSFPPRDWMSSAMSRWKTAAVGVLG
jgi:D-3-phosphoglycerate dehydrogenase